jgi:phosphoglycolate phosphatase-like HAD superfamily hydrolase
MINAAMEKCNVKIKNKVLKVGDTVVDIFEGKNAGVLTAAVLTGTQKKSDLEKFEPDYIIDSIKDIKTLNI